MLDLLVPCEGREDDWRFWSVSSAYLFKLPFVESILLVGAHSALRLTGSASHCSLDAELLPPLGSESAAGAATHSPFNKSRLLRNAAGMSNANVLMFLDSDIRISPGVIDRLYRLLLEAPRECCVHLARVMESDPARRRAVVAGWWPQCSTASDGRPLIRLLPWQSSGWRPGFGNLMLSRSHYLAVGQHDPAYVHYGWEDLDLLVRLQLAGIQVLAAGQACHRSHSDSMRSLAGYSRTQAVALMRDVFASKFRAYLQAD